ncbi:MAG: hypothetical protein WC254_01325 [Candidatus Woesearchaeota archaeon]
MTLKEWIIAFIRGKDAIKQQLVSLNEGTIVHAVYKDNKTQDFFAKETLDDLHDVFVAAKKSDSDPLYSVHVACYNTSHNLKILVQHWKEYVAHQRLFFYFVNPDSTTEIKWVVNPWLHNRISDDKKLEIGLKSLFSMVEEWKK